jgi:hypothetical protein
MKPAVALINASDDTVEMVQRMLSATGIDCLTGCHFADLKKGNVDFAQFLGKHDPQVVIFDISPPYADSTALEIVGKPYDLQQITAAITAALRTAEAANEVSP